MWSKLFTSFLLKFQDDYKNFFLLKTLCTLFQANEWLSDWRNVQRFMRADPTNAASIWIKCPLQKIFILKRKKCISAGQYGDTRISIIGFTSCSATNLKFRHLKHVWKKRLKKARLKGIQHNQIYHYLFVKPNCH